MAERDAFNEETQKHIGEVQRRMWKAIQNLHKRRRVHDQSKLLDPEVEGFMAMARDNPLKGCTYGSAEYFDALARYPDAILHHYAENDHHPEHWAVADPGDLMATPFYDQALVSNGYAIRRMSLMAIIEMLCDWSAATERMKDGDLRRSIEFNSERFGYSDELKHILINTARELGMMDE